MASYPKELAQDAAYQSHTSRLNELWSLPRPAKGLNTNNNNKVRNFAGPSGRADYGPSPAVIVGSNPTGGMVVCLL